MELFDTLELVGMSEAFDAPSQFLFNLFFGTSRITFESEEIMFDKIKSSRRIAPYVSPHIPGKVHALRGGTAKTFRPAYVKPKAPVNPGAVIKRRPGEAPLGSLSREERFNRIVVQEFQDQLDMIARREEQMAVEILRTGKVIVESPEYPRMEVDFARPANQTVVLAGTARWGETGVNPLDDIKAWAELVHVSSGTHPGRVIFDPKAAGLFLANEQLQKILDNRRQVSGSFELAGQATGGTPGLEAVFIGSIGQFEFWQYQAIYQADNGAMQKFMPDNTVIMGSAGIEGHACYGAIQDLEGLQAMERFPKMWEEKDPSVAMLMTQSAPLPVPANIEASFCATVR
ncbi:major capsid protein [Aquibium microcysteis]|uniref:major capsid protein n=1 Tax=Aquibium microcysteis TaxID=675281 RepID=UPI00165D029E|nr:major capsid protein [Aquibium microcysteis]